MNQPRDDRTPPVAQGRPSRGPIGLVLDLFSNVRFGIVLLTILFVYCTVGSAGIVLPTRGAPDFTVLGIPFQHSMLRQWRIFELTEFEWFHTTAFNALIALICANIIVTTLRRIRLSVINLGVWTIHAGIITLCVGSVIYFGTKIEGDAPVIRREVGIRVPGLTSPVTLAAIPGNSISVMGDAGAYQFRIANIDPSWALLSGADEGRTAYAVSVDITTPTQNFARTLLAGFPEYTEDVIPGRGRVKKLEEFGGDAILDDTIEMTLAPRAAKEFWIKDTAAVYSREVGATQWSMRPISGLPRYNDYVPDVNRDIWPVRATPGMRPLTAAPLTLPVPGADGQADALDGSQVRITGFLRYAAMAPGWMDGGDALNPMVEFTLRDPDGELITTDTMLAFDPVDRTKLGGSVVFDWVSGVEDLKRYAEPAPRTLTIGIPATGDSLVISVDPAELEDTERQPTPIGASGFSYKILDVVDRLPLSDNSVVTLVRVEFTTPDSKFTRWVFEEAARTRDNHETAPEDPHKPALPDPRIQTTYKSGHTATLTIVAGPGEIGLRVYSKPESGPIEMKQATAGETLGVVGDFRLTIRRFVANALEAARPQIIPWEQRDKDADAAQLYAMVKVEVTGGGRTESRWIPFHRYAFDSKSETPPSLSRYEPVEITLASGTKVELLVSRERRELPNPVLLDDFILTTHVGGFSGRVSSVRDWTSILRFQTTDGTSAPMEVSTNNPKEFGGLWFFQAFWDAPRAGRPPALAFTGLGVGNRNGVYTQLAGCCISVAGMLYAFYVKPIIRRRRKDAALAAHAVKSAADSVSSPRSVAVHAQANDLATSEESETLVGSQSEDRS